MTKQLYVAFWDRAEGGDRESWSVFYTPFVISDDPDRAEEMAWEQVREAIKDDIEWAFPDDEDPSDEEIEKFMRSEYHVELRTPEKTE